MSLSPEQRRAYRAIAHDLKPVIIAGDKGLSEGLQEELERALNDHELIKVSMHKPKDKKQMAADLAEGSKAQLAGLLGHTVILYRQHKEKPRIRVPQRDVAEVSETTDE